MSIILRTLTIKNFLSIGNVTQTLDLSLHGLTLVVGENIDVGGGNSKNGAGKSSLLQAISYVLYGEPLTDIRLDNLCNNINGKGMLVTITFECDGINYIIERGRKPNILKFYVNGEANDAKGENKNTQIDIERVMGMSHLMFKHIVALNTYTNPFMRLKASEQREVIEELFGITQLSQRAVSLKALMDVTKEHQRDEEAKLTANVEANARIEQAIEQAKSQANVWQISHDKQIQLLLDKAEETGSIDIDAEIAIFDQIENWLIQKREVDEVIQQTQKEITGHTVEIAKLQKEIKRLREVSLDTGEIVRLESQRKRYLTEAEDDITPQINRLNSEGSRRRKETESKIAIAEKLAVEVVALQDQIDNPNVHTCSTCGQGLAGTDHLAKVLKKLQKQVDDISSQIEKAMSDADDCNNEAISIETEITKVKESSTKKKEESLIKAQAILEDIETAKEKIAEQKSITENHIKELENAIETIQEQKSTNETIVVEAQSMLDSIGKKPVSRYSNKEAVWKIKQEYDVLLVQIEAETNKPNLYSSKIEALENTLVLISYDRVNELTLRLKHETFLYKLLTTKDSFIRKKIVDQNLFYLNNRLNHYLERLYLPHEVRFLPDLTVEISILGHQLDFDQLSRGEMNRVILSTAWAFRDVYESLNSSSNLLGVDELLDFGLDDHGVESALTVLQSMALDRKKNVFLISHKENLLGRADRIMTIRKENQFTTILTD